MQENYSSADQNLLENGNDDLRKKQMKKKLIISISIAVIVTIIVVLTYVLLFNISSYLHKMSETEQVNSNSVNSISFNNEADNSWGEI